MLSNNEKGPAPERAKGPNNNQLHELYRDPVPKSSTKLEQIGNLLLTLDGIKLAPHGVRWFTSLLLLAGEQSRAKGDLDLAGYYSQLALTTLTVTEDS